MKIPCLPLEKLAHLQCHQFLLLDLLLPLPSILEQTAANRCRKCRLCAQALLLNNPFSILFSQNEFVFVKNQSKCEEAAQAAAGSDPSSSLPWPVSSAGGRRPHHNSTSTAMAPPPSHAARVDAPLMDRRAELGLCLLELVAELDEGGDRVAVANFSATRSTRDGR
jgi:hypothetical protein